MGYTKAGWPQLIEGDDRHLLDQNITASFTEEELRQHIKRMECWEDGYHDLAQNISEDRTWLEIKCLRCGYTDSWPKPFGCQ